MSDRNATQDRAANVGEIRAIRKSDGRLLWQCWLGHGHQLPIEDMFPPELAGLAVPWELWVRLPGELEFAVKDMPDE